MVRLLSIKNEWRLNNVEFIGHVPHWQAPGWLHKGDACVRPGYGLPLERYGISPNKIHEYLAAARPLILCGHLPHNVVLLANCGMSVPPGNPVAIADAAKRLMILSPPEREAMGLRGQRYAEANHNFRSLAMRLEGVLLSVIGENSQVPHHDRHS